MRVWWWRWRWVREREGVRAKTPKLLHRIAHAVYRLVCMHRLKGREEGRAQTTAQAVSSNMEGLPQGRDSCICQHKSH
jgi:hypothetical protein